MGKTLKELYGKYLAEFAQISHAAEKIDETEIYEEANPQTRKYLSLITKDNLLPDSHINNIENFKEFYDAVVSGGKSGVVMMDHYSNMDLPCFLDLLENSGQEWAKDFAHRIVAIAGMKLNEADPIVRALTESFTRVVIYPTRSLNAVEQSDASEEEKEAERLRARKINFAAMRAMDGCKKRGQIILVFPSGTRYRPGKPETKRGLREIDSYLRLFDLLLPVSINGSVLRFNPENPENMIMDIVVPDVVTLTAGKMIECKPFRNKILETVPADHPDPKQVTVDAVMNILEDLHNSEEK
ncbi:MAG: 1-acyl-sn-glycerol-3-phosphate acyltransferase [Treponema sp.]|nr:1-acyl-sn-glycerol-3-phosphate acyltransferase [Treponema sp.]